MKTVLFRALIFSAVATAMSASNPLAAAFEEGKPTLNIRTRYEDVSQTGLNDATALTLRARVGYTTGQVSGWQAHFDLEHITALDSDQYNQAGLNPGGAGRAVIADPEHTEINQVFLRYTHNQTTVTAGRQRFVLDNVRFIGDVGWRQNQQTFDAIVVQDQNAENLKLTYAYLHQINRIFGDDHPAGQWDSDSHLFNVHHDGLSLGALTGYAYLLDFDNAAANSCATYGLSFDGKKSINDDVALTYRAEYAAQSNYGSSPLSYSTHYLSLSVGFDSDPWSVAFNHEILGSDRGVGFKTPLATLHAFNGWADQFLNTPAQGLKDTYLTVVGNVIFGAKLIVSYHDFETDQDSLDAGNELDILLEKTFNQHYTVGVKYADYQADDEFPSLVDTEKFWVYGQVKF